MALPPTLEEFYNHGPGAAVWDSLGRRVAQLDVASNRIRLPSHGLSTNSPLQVSAGPAYDGAGTLPTGLSAFTVYYARIVSTSVFELAETADGAAVDFTTAGTTGMVIEVDNGPALEQALAWVTDRFLACAAEHGWAEPAAGWGGDVKDRICDLVAWPQLDRRGYKDEGKDGYEKRWLLARAELCTVVPLGVEIPAAGSASAPATGFGSSGWGEEPRGFLGQTATEPRRRAVIS
jgi:hypothetical protein